MLSSPKPAALEYQPAQLVLARRWTDEVEDAPVKSRLVPGDCRSVTKPIYPAKSPVISASVKYSQPATTSGRIVVFNRSVTQPKQLRGVEYLAGVSRANPAVTPTATQTE